MLRHTVIGTAKRPRLNVYRGNRNIFVQLIDDSDGKTLLGVSSLKIGPGLSGRERAKKVAEMVAKEAEAKKISSVVFDRGGFKYHGQIKEIADTLRSAGFKI
jgi:large subunit ribosomal protein L18